MKLSFLAATSISLAALVSSCGSSNPQASSELQASSNSEWKDVTTTDGKTASTCAKTPANCSMQDPLSGLMWSKNLGDMEDWQGALQACAALTHNGQEAGTWRLPKKEELNDAYAHQISDAASGNWISVEEMKRDYFWSASSYSNGTDNAWVVNLGGGYTSNSSEFYYSAVVCVR